VKYSASLNKCIKYFALCGIALCVFLLIMPIITALIISAAQTMWKVKKLRVTTGLAIFLVTWPVILILGLIYHLLGKIFSTKKVSLRRTLNKGTDTYIRFFERGHF